MDPALYDEAQHRAQLLRQMRAAETVVYAAAFAPPFVSSEPTLVAATSTGALHVFALKPALQPQYWERVTQQRCGATQLGWSKHQYATDGGVCVCVLGRPRIQDLRCRSKRTRRKSTRSRSPATPLTHCS